jgi:anti-sigma factor RsiW
VRAWPYGRGWRSQERGRGAREVNHDLPEMPPDDSLSAFLDDELDAHERSALEVRLAEDPNLAAELEALRSIKEQVGELPRVSAPPDFAARIMSEVVPLAAAKGAKAMHPENHGAEGAKKRAMRRHEERKRKKSEAAAGSSSGGEKKKRSSRKKSGSRKKRDPFAEDPFDALPPPDLEALGDTLSSFIDGELDVAEAERLEALIAREPTVAEEVEALRGTRQRVKSLPRLEAPASLLTNVLDQIDELEREELRAVQRAQAAKLTLWRNLTRFAQAACFLLVVGGGMALTSPEERPFSEARLARTQGRSGTKRPFLNPALKKEHKSVPRAAKTKAAAPQPLVVDQLGQRSYDAKWELAANADLEQVQTTARRLVVRYTGGRFQEARGQNELGFVVHVPANQVDDLAVALERATEVGVNAAFTETLDALHTEQDRVTLKNGFVMVGQVDVRGNQVFVASATGLRQSFPRKGVERIDFAKAIRCVRVLIR